MNLEFTIEPVAFKIEELNQKQRAIQERAVARAQRYLVCEGELLESIIEVDQHKIYEKFGLEYITPYCVKHMRLDPDLAGLMVRLARKSQAVPELREAIVEGKVSISNAKAIASVITKENQAEWIEKAKTLSKHKLIREVAQQFPENARPEKARMIGNGRVQVILNLSEEEYDRRCEIKNLVSQSLRKSATDSEVEVAMMDLYQFHKDPVRKAERAAKRKESDKFRAGSSKLKTKHPNPWPVQSDIPAEIQHIVNLRDRRMCKGHHPDGSVCGSMRWVHLHHIVPKSRGGLDVPENIITLCSAHHRLWHKREEEKYRGGAKSRSSNA